MALAELCSGSHFDIYAWVDEGGCPAQDFLDRLVRKSNTDRERILNLIEKTAKDGIINNPHHCKHLEGEIYEFKAPRGARLLWFYGGVRKSIVCANGFVKTRTKTPRDEIKRAEKIRKKYLEETDHEH
jgi:hypothetical protein